MKKNLRDRILIREPKEQYLSIVAKSCPSLRVLASNMLNTKHTKHKKSP